MSEREQIAVLLARIEELEAALKPFAEFGALLESRRCRDDSHLALPGFTKESLPTLGDCRRAATLLQGHE